MNHIDNAINKAMTGDAFEGVLYDTIRLKSNDYPFTSEYGCFFPLLEVVYFHNRSTEVEFDDKRFFTPEHIQKNLHVFLNKANWTEDLEDEDARFMWKGRCYTNTTFEAMMFRVFFALLRHAPRRGTNTYRDDLAHFKVLQDFGIKSVNMQIVSDRSGLKICMFKAKSGLNVISVGNYPVDGKHGDIYDAAKHLLPKDFDPICMIRVSGLNNLFYLYE